MIRCLCRASEAELEEVSQERAQLAPKLEEARWSLRQADKAREGLHADLAASQQVNTSVSRTGDYHVHQLARALQLAALV